MARFTRQSSGLVFGGILLLATACDPNTTKLQWMPDMADAPTVKAQENVLQPPDHSVTMESRDYGQTPDDAERLFTNPFPRSAEVVERGKVLYGYFCVPCHGADAKGSGTLRGLFPQPPDITAANYRARKDGFFYHRITNGSAIMPAYGHSISSDERWMIIHYLRTLQGGSH